MAFDLIKRVPRLWQQTKGKKKGEASFFFFCYFTQKRALKKARIIFAHFFISICKEYEKSSLWKLALFQSVISNCESSKSGDGWLPQCLGSTQSWQMSISLVVCLVCINTFSCFLCKKIIKSFQGQKLCKESFAVVVTAKYCGRN